jgi:hypothetical protein
VSSLERIYVSSGSRFLGRMGLSEVSVSEGGEVYDFECASGFAGDVCYKESPPLLYENGRQYCVLHSPDSHKEIAFEEAFKKRLREENFNFYGVYFPSRVDFTMDYFMGDSWDKFGAPVNFAYATFEEEAIFREVLFKEDVDFQGATFKGEVSFKYVTFEGVAGFTYTTFLEEANNATSTARHGQQWLKS